MGDQYTVHARDGFEVCLNEAGSEFHIMLKATDEADTRHVVAWPNHRTAGAYAEQWLTPDDLVAMVVEMIRVASVWVWDECALLDAAALKVMELGAYAAPREPSDDGEEISGLVADVAAAAVSPPRRTRDADLPAVWSAHG